MRKILPPFLFNLSGHIQTSNTCQQRGNDINKSKSKPVNLKSDVQQMNILILWN